MKKVYNCGHCGTVHEQKAAAIECCGGYEELSYQCENCKALFNKKPSGRCLNCSIRLTIKKVGELVERLKQCPQDHKIRFHYQGREIEISDLIGENKVEKTVILFQK